MTAPKRKPKAAQAPLPLAINEGVHLNLPDEIYFEQHALGSSDFHVLDKDTPSWWYGSAFNPERRDQRRRNRALVFGSALHALLLEGENTYARRFIVAPDAEKSFAESRKEILELLAKRGARVPAGKDSFDWGKLLGAVREAGVSHLVRQTAQAEYEAAKRAGFQTITEDEDRRLRRMAYHIGQHHDLGPSLKKGFSEVSVFWRPENRPHILLRARFDKLLTGFTIDLKTFSNPRDDSPEDATLHAITNNGYDIQAEHYRDARVQFARFVKEGAVYAWSVEQGQLQRATVLARQKTDLKEIAEFADWVWVWIFYQVQNDDAGSERAPVVVPWHTKPSGEMFENARAAIDRALDNYTAWVERAGLSQPWAEIHPIRQLPMDRLKRLAFKRTAQQ